MTPRSHVKCVALCMLLYASCMTAHKDHDGIVLKCDHVNISKVLAMPSLFNDSSGYQAYELASGSQKRVPGRHEITFHMPKAQFHELSLGEVDVSPLVFREPLVPPLGGYKYGKDGASTNEESVGFGAISDGLSIAQRDKFWQPIFYRPEPMPGLNMVVMYQMLDSAFRGTEGSGWQKLPDQAIVKLYHRDAVLDTIYPELKVRGHLDKSGFKILFNCLRAHFDSLYRTYHPIRGATWGAGNRNAAWAFEDKPFRELIRRHSWLTRDSIVVQLYCSPADILRKYYRYGGKDNLLFDSLSCTYKNVPQGTADAVDNAMDIQWEDLAISITYTLASGIIF